MTQVKDKKQKSPTPRKGTKMSVVGIKDWGPSSQKYQDHMGRWVKDYYEESYLGMFYPDGNPDGNFFWEYDSDDEMIDRNGYGISEDNDTVTKNLRYGDLLEIFENGIEYGIKEMKREFILEEIKLQCGWLNQDEKKRLENTKYPVNPFDDWIKEQKEIWKEIEEREVT